MDKGVVTIKHIARVIRGATLCSSNNIRVNRGRGRGGLFVPRSWKGGDDSTIYYGDIPT